MSASMTIASGEMAETIQYDYSVAASYGNGISCEGMREKAKYISGIEKASKRRARSVSKET